MATGSSEHTSIAGVGIIAETLRLADDALGLPIFSFKILRYNLEFVRYFSSPLTLVGLFWVANSYPASTHRPTLTQIHSYRNSKNSLRGDTTPGCLTGRRRCGTSITTRQRFGINTSLFNCSMGDVDTRAAT